MKPMTLNRRNFLFGSAAAMTLAGCNTAKTGLRPRKPGERLNFALVGCGIQGRGLLGGFLKQKDILVRAVCDCDRIRREESAKTVVNYYATKEKPAMNVDCAALADFRDIVNDPTIDVVCIATPDHWHAYIAVEMMKHGKDVYCEKPLTYNVDEARKVMAAAEKYGRVFQTGAMQRSWDNFRTAVMVVRNGIIGDVHHVDANFGNVDIVLGGPSNVHRFFDKPENAATEGAPNPDCDWDMWLGPAPWAPYSDQLAPRGVNKFYPMFWRFDDHYGAGYTGDWGAHHLDIAQWGLDLDKSGPVKVIRSDEPYSQLAVHGCRRQTGMKFVIRKAYGDVIMEHRPAGVWGTVFYGTKGIVAVNRGKIAVWLGDGAKVVPDAALRKQLDEGTYAGMKAVVCSIAKDYGTQATERKDDKLATAVKTLKETFALEKAKVQVYDSLKDGSHIGNFVRCCLTREETCSTAETGARASILCQLCNLSYVYDTGFDWDPVKNDFANGTGHGISLKRDYCRNGWEVVV